MGTPWRTLLILLGVWLGVADRCCQGNCDRCCTFGSCSSLSPSKSYYLSSMSCSRPPPGGCALCPAGYFCTSTDDPGIINPCPAGRYSDPGATACCPFNTTYYAGTRAQGFCCEPGSYGAPDSNTCSRCPAGSFCPAGAPTPCPSGTYNPFPGAITSSSCRVCPTVRGRFALLPPGPLPPPRRPPSPPPSPPPRRPPSPPPSPPPTPHPPTHTSFHSPAAGPFYSRGHQLQAVLRPACLPAPPLPLLGLR